MEAFSVLVGAISPVTCKQSHLNIVYILSEYDIISYSDMIYTAMADIRAGPRGRAVTRVFATAFGMLRTGRGCAGPPGLITVADIRAGTRVCAVSPESLLLHLLGFGRGCACARARVGPADRVVRVSAGARSSLGFGRVYASARSRQVLFCRSRRGSGGSARPRGLAVALAARFHISGPNVLFVGAVDAEDVWRHNAVV